jgi:hypothetical protein
MSSSINTLGGGLDFSGLGEGQVVGLYKNENGLQSFIKNMEFPVTS